MTAGLNFEILKKKNNFFFPKISESIKKPENDFLKIQFKKIN